MAELELAKMPFQDFYKWLTSKQLDEVSLRQHHFPRADTKQADKVAIFNVPHKYFCSIRTPNRRRCRFCFSIYTVDAKGIQPPNNSCSYHSGRRPRPGKTFPCCQGSLGSVPCKSRDFHVTSDVDTKNLFNFIRSSECNNKERAIYSIDCEFVHTATGHELAAISIIDQDGKCLLNTFVRPRNAIVDYLPQFSNLKAENFSLNSKECISMDEYRMKMRQLLGPDVIIIGHGIQQDLLRMEVIHDKVVDTSLLFPHPDGKTYTIGLATLKNTYLGDVQFPDSMSKALEDCSLTMKIVQLLFLKKIILST